MSPPQIEKNEVDPPSYSGRESKHLKVGGCSILALCRATK